MMADEIKIIGVVGAGTMGRGIAQVVAESGFDVLLYDNNPDALRSTAERLAQRLGEIKNRLKIAESLEDFKNADFVIEAVVENLAVKQNIFRSLDAICRQEVILASNTSSIPIAKIAEATSRRDRVMGMHFMNPPYAVTLMELIRSSFTSGETFNSVKNLSLRLRRSPVIESADSPGFIVNLVLMSAINEAAKAVQNGRGTAEDVNKSVIMGVGGSKGMPILELADLIGLDICVDILKTMKCKPCNLLKTLVKEGSLGRKTGKGFFDYSKK